MRRSVEFCPELSSSFFFFFQAEDGIRDLTVTGVRRVLFRSGAYNRDYLRYRKRRGYRLRRGDAATLTRFLELLRNEDAIVQHRTPAVTTPVECLLEKFDVYLRNERALALATRLYYGLFVRQFLNARFGSGHVELGTVCAADITGF